MKKDLNNFQLDDNQKKLLKLLEKTVGCINDQTFFSKLRNFFYKNRLKNGVYLYGTVGVGKTMLMKLFYDKVNVPKEMLHYQKFIHNLHKKIHALKKESSREIIQKVASDIAERAKVICMDEFEIKDITDAMIMLYLFHYLIENKVFIFLTSNTIPDNLYKDGIQRESFLPFIENIKNSFQVLCLEGKTDYRYNVISNIEKRILYPFSKKNDIAFSNIKKRLCDKEEISNIHITVFGRDLFFSRVHQNILFTDFKELFERNIGYIDYVNITEYFNVIVVEKVRKILPEEKDIILRFINFIDSAYFNKVILFMEIECLPEEIYIAMDKKAEFIRTVSRLNEMNSDQYIAYRNEKL